VRSKSVQLNLFVPEDVRQGDQDGSSADAGPPHCWTYRAEYLLKRSTTALPTTTPTNHLRSRYQPGHEHYLSYEEKKAECNRIGLECVPLIYEGMIERRSQFRLCGSRIRAGRH